MESEFFDIVKSEKEKAIAKFNRFRRITKLRQILEVVAVLGLFSWSSARAPAVFRTAAGVFVEVSSYLFNHHVVFLIGNVIIVLLFVLCRRNAAGGSLAPGDFYDDYVKHSEAAVHHQRDPTLPPPPCPIIETVDCGSAAGAVEEKQIVVCTEIEKQARQCDDVSEAIEKATRQIRKFQRTQSEKLRREITTSPQAELRRSETQTRRKTAVSTNLERLSSEEFRRTIDDFIDANWCKKKNQTEENGKRQLLRMY